MNASPAENTEIGKAQPMAGLPHQASREQHCHFSDGSNRRHRGAGYFAKYLTGLKSCDLEFLKLAGISSWGGRKPPGEWLPRWDCGNATGNTKLSEREQEAKTKDRPEGHYLPGPPQVKRRPLLWAMPEHPSECLRRGRVRGTGTGRPNRQHSTAAARQHGSNMMAARWHSSPSSSRLVVTRYHDRRNSTDLSGCAASTSATKSPGWQAAWSPSRSES